MYLFIYLFYLFVYLPIYISIYSDISTCHFHSTCSSCSNTVGCQWTENGCVYNNPNQFNFTSCLSSSSNYTCSHSHCQPCVSNQECGWTLDKGCQPRTNGILLIKN